MTSLILAVPMCIVGVLAIEKNPSRSYTLIESPNDVSVRLTDQFGVSFPNYHTRVTSFGCTVDSVGWPSTDPKEAYGLLQKSVGFPMHALSGEHARLPAGRSVAKHMVTISPLGNSMTIPTRVHIVGGAVDWAFAAGIVWSMLFGPRYLRRFRRLRRHLCALCGYPRSTSPYCPECGQATGRFLYRPANGA